MSLHTRAIAALPIHEALPALHEALAGAGRAVLQAPPGAGKTTGVPLSLLNAPWLGTSRILMLEPRRLATRAAARRMASQLGESVGETVGFRVRGESRVGPRTRVEVVTEGILTRMLVDDPTLDGVGLVIFDEFHERSIHADLGLALALRTRELLRPDLRMLVMSATLDGSRVASLIGDAPIVTSEGRMYPVERRYLPPRAGARVEELVAAAVKHALSQHDGSVLAFLPGAAEIHRCMSMLERSVPGTVRVLPLYGDLAASDQDAAIAASRRRASARWCLRRPSRRRASPSTA
jgi:ATP-dependent helicase HrpB